MPDRGEAPLFMEDLVEEVEAEVFLPEVAVDTLEARVAFGVVHKLVVVVVHIIQVQIKLIYKIK